ncbi:MAG: hypothetical protein K0Q70_2521 [Rhodospirillales bacterium]|nr:hypothetical protein [Rhodospirillales bacterium]
MGGLAGHGIICPFGRPGSRHNTSCHVIVNGGVLFGRDEFRHSLRGMDKITLDYIDKQIVRASFDTTAGLTKSEYEQFRVIAEMADADPALLRRLDQEASFWRQNMVDYRTGERVVVDAVTMPTDLFIDFMIVARKAVSARSGGDYAKRLQS